jgi:hypothetical protein
MIKKLILCVTMASCLSIAASEERRTITERDLIANSIEYTVRNPIKVTVISYLVINQILNGKDSLMCQGYKWVTVSLPRIITEDGRKVIERIKESSATVYEFLRSSFIKNPQA